MKRIGEALAGAAFILLMLWMAIYGERPADMMCRWNGGPCEKCKPIVVGGVMEMAGCPQ